MIPPYEHRSMYKLDIPQECNGFKVDDLVEYDKNGTIQRGYFYCFRQFGYNWFAWIYTNKDTLELVDCIFINDLQKIS